MLPPLQGNDEFQFEVNEKKIVFPPPKSMNFVPKPPNFYLCITGGFIKSG